ncbi:DUF1819 family protein [Miniphocaeibacter halophilus]|uniref:DUF1819 family protein n=1 Tax=Miniphocaeibacter halophilus TaxID=2931922 RepID=A0AC61MN65_9FIRM|nr:DUF1819 family protein [Miniphocaeibacter halophilus]QQK06962.1 DUF1819 family protein [Miniphocaeibacter halophilus]
MARKYSAGIVSKGFWFIEFKKYINLLNEGYSPQEIRKKQEKENFLAAPSKDYAIKILGEMKRRTTALPKKILEYFQNTDISTQKIINLLGVLLTDQLLFEFIYTKYREEIQLGTKEYNPSIVRIFLREMQNRNEEVAKFSDNSIKRMTGAYGTYLKEAGLLENIDGKTYYKNIFLDLELERLMKEEGLNSYIKAIKGEY